MYKLRQFLLQRGADHVRARLRHQRVQGGRRRDRDERRPPNRVLREELRFVDRRVGVDVARGRGGSDDGAYAGHWKGPRPVCYKINLCFRRFGCGTGQLTGLNTYYIARDPKMLGAGRRSSRAHDRAYIGTIPGSATISPCTITMDHDAIVCSMID